MRGQLSPPLGVDARSPAATLSPSREIAELSNPATVRFWTVQFSSAAQLCPTLFNPMNCSMPGLRVHHQLLKFTQTHVH